jgi:hypothetical protein
MFDPVTFKLFVGLLADRFRLISFALGDAMCDAIFGGLAFRFAACGALARHPQIYNFSHAEARW